MNILFFCHADFACNSMSHIAGFAAGLRALGHASAVAIPGDDLGSATVLGENPPFHPCVFSDSWTRATEIFPDRQPADILHAWTPREHVRRAVERCREEMPAARLFIHLEDNEEHITACFSGLDFARLRELPDTELVTRVPIHLSHPREYVRFMKNADGITGITGRLADFAPPGVPFTELLPGVDFHAFHPGPPDLALRASLGIRADEKIICYPGSSHLANSEEMQNLYEAVFLLNRGGTPCRLIRTGSDEVDFLARFDSGQLKTHVLHLGFVEKTRLPDLLRLAAVLIQPGADDDFNRYRLPSKLPEFLASGRPVILPRTNIAHRIKSGHDALFLESGSPQEIHDLCVRVFTDPSLAQRLAQAGAAFARRHFDPLVNAGTLAGFYWPRQSVWEQAREQLQGMLGGDFFFRRHWRKH